MTPHDYGNHRDADAPKTVTRLLGRSDGVWPSESRQEPIARALIKQRGQINARAYEQAKARKAAEG